MAFHIPISQPLVRSTIDELPNRWLATWIAKYKTTCERCGAAGPHSRVYVTIPDERPTPDPRVICDACDEMLVALSNATPTCLAVRWWVERREPGWGQSLETLYAAGLRVGRGEALYTCESDDARYQWVRDTAAAFDTSEAVPRDLVQTEPGGQGDAK